MFKDGAPREEAATMTAQKMGRQKTPEPRKENTPERDAPPWRLGATVGGMTSDPRTHLSVSALRKEPMIAGAR
jgi:hypothetical protein